MWVLGWAGLSAVLVATVAYDHTTPYPGVAALVPTLGAAAIIVAGQVAASSRPAVGWFLSVRPLRWLGKVSYGWYLWHWPALVLFKGYTHNNSWPTLVGVTMGALVLAWASTALLERPIMSSGELKRNLQASLSVGITGTIAAAAVTMTLGVLAVNLASGAASSNPSVSFESVFGADTGAKSGPVTPNPFKAFDDRPDRDECLVPLGKREQPDTCVDGPPDGVPAVLFGDSHAQQWLPVVQAIAKENNWRLNQFTKAACPVAALQPRDGRTDPFTKSDCLGWREDSVNAIIALKPKYIVISSLSTYVPDYQEFKTAWDQTLSQLRATGAKIDLLAGYAVPEQEHARMHLGRHRQLVRVRLRPEQHPPDRTHCHRPGSGPEPRHPGARPQRIPVRGQQMPRGAQRHVALPRRLPPDSNRGQGAVAGCPSADP